MKIYKYKGAPPRRGLFDQITLARPKKIERQFEMHPG